MPVKIHIKENPAGFERFGASMDAHNHHRGLERGRSGIASKATCPPEDFLAQTGTRTRGRLRSRTGALTRRSAGSATLLRASRSPTRRPKPLYWAGVAKYKASNDPTPLKETARALQSQYRESSWAKKASVWAA